MVAVHSRRSGCLLLDFGAKMQVTKRAGVRRAGRKRLARHAAGAETVGLRTAESVSHAHKSGASMKATAVPPQPVVFSMASPRIVQTQPVCNVDVQATRRWHHTDLPNRLARRILRHPLHAEACA